MENVFGEKTVSYSILAFSIISIISSFAFGNAIFAIISSFLMLLSIAYLYSGKLINRLIIAGTKPIIIYKGYELSNNLASAILRKGQYYESISMAELILSSQVNPSNYSFENIISRINVPFEYKIELKGLSEKKLVDELETKMHIKEIELSNASNERDSIRLRREIEAIEGEIKAISSGSKPLDVKFIIKCKAISQSLIEATTTSQKNVEHVASIFANEFNLSYSLLKGESLLEEL